MQLRLHTQMLKERLDECEERAFAGDSVAVQSYISDARQMITEFRQARELFPKEKVRAWVRSHATFVCELISFSGHQISCQVQDREVGPLRVSNCYCN